MVNFKSSCFVESLHLTLKEMPKWAKEGLGEEIHIKVAAKGAEGDNPNGKIVLQTKDGVNAENDPALALVEAMRDGEVPVGSVLTPVAINSAIMLFFFFLAHTIFEVLRVFAQPRSQILSVKMVSNFAPSCRPNLAQALPSCARTLPIHA